MKHLSRQRIGLPQALESVLLSNIAKIFNACSLLQRWIAKNEKAQQSRWA